MELKTIKDLWKEIANTLINQFCEYFNWKPREKENCLFSSLFGGVELAELVLKGSV